MANIKSSKKDIRRIAKRRVQNAQTKARLRTYAKSILHLLNEKKVDEARDMFHRYSAFLDRAGRHNLVHHRQASRRKSRMAALINRTAREASA